jgi:L-lactate dehydrogenase complex protein LldG
MERSEMKKAEKLAKSMREAAERVSATVTSVASMDEAYAYAAGICADKAPAENLLVPPVAAETAGTGEKILAAPGLDAEEYKKLAKVCGERGVTLIQSGLRERLGGVDVGFTVADRGVAETATMVHVSENEEVRLATMVCEIHVIVMPVSRIAGTALEIEEELAAMMAKPGSYTAFISGASRTADIERVLALGVHGPLELHLSLSEDS